MAEIAVMGAGIFGLSAAFELARRGARVVVIERDRVGAGASGGVVGALAPHVPEQWNAKKAFQFESLIQAESFWSEVARTGGRDPGYARLGRVQPLADAAAVALARARAENARKLWRGLAEWRVVDATDMAGLRLHSPTGLVVADTLTARLSPRRAGVALVAALAALGAEVRLGDAPPPAAARVIWATGMPGLTALGDDLGVAMGGAVKGQAALLAADWRDAPQVFSEGLHLVPHADATVAIGSTSERSFDDPAATDDGLDRLIARARAIAPDLRDAPVLERWAGLRPRSPSRAPMLGPWPGRDGHFVMNGGFKIGFGMAPRLAQVIADLVLDGQDAIPEGFRVSDNLPSV
ncbi:MAG: Glycine/D-amino acid oxidases (deaminating) [Rhodobacteraceae bacterium HLUCCA12]|nr:MAG: Glycine/D-amino acid oxidases (deaminating) [Rhodobacteraceae bacterium HLUCCA12]